MGRKRDTSRQDRWYFNKQHECYHLGYCYKRYERAYLFIVPDIRESTHLSWYPRNRSAALALLEQRIIYHNNKSAGVTPVASVYELFAEYIKVHYPNISKSSQDNIKAAMQVYFTEDCPLDIPDLRAKLLEKKTYQQTHSIFI